MTRPRPPGRPDRRRGGRAGRRLARNALACRRRAGRGGGAGERARRVGRLDPSPTRTSVLVIGAGPGELVTALVLARYGVEVLLVERRQGTSTCLRALVISTRNMELMRSWGLEDAGAGRCGRRAALRLGMPHARLGRGDPDAAGLPLAGRDGADQPDRSGMGPAEPSRAAVAEAAGLAAQCHGAVRGCLGQPHAGRQRYLRRAEH